MAFNPENPCEAIITQKKITKDNEPTTYTLFDCKSCDINVGWVGGTPSKNAENIALLKLAACKKLNDTENI